MSGLAQVWRPQLRLAATSVAVAEIAHGRCWWPMVQMRVWYIEGWCHRWTIRWRHHNTLRKL